MIIIPLGFHCNISYLNKGLCIKKETGVFEWFESRSLQYITDVINTLTNNPKENVVFKNESFVYLLNINFLSGHYTNNIDQYKLTFQRRYARFINIINKEDNIYFIRIHPLGNFTTKNEIELFIESIKRINPNIKFNFLLIDTIHNDCDINFITIDIDNVISKDGIYIHFNVTFSAIVVKPEKNLPLSFKPTLILSKGIFGKLYDHINIFIPSVNMGGWEFSEEENVFKNKDDRIDKDTMVDATIKDIKYNTTKYNCICNFVKI